MAHTPQRALITAAASGIGHATAKAYLEAGAKVFICDVDKVALDRVLTDDKRLAGMIADVADEAQVTAFFDKGLKHLGGLDVLVANAGIAGPTAAVETIALADWRRTLGVNLDGAFLCAKHAAPILKQQKGGSIVLLSSTAGLMGFERRAPYCASKWAIRGFARTLAVELGPHGIRVNTVCPGPVEGARIDGVIERDARARGITPEALRNEYLARASLRTFIKAEDIAKAILFLTSPDGAKITGQDIIVDGHMTHH